MSENKPDLMAEVAACPFCGGTPTSTEDEDDHVFVVGCLNCGYDLYSGPVGVGWFKSLPDAIAAWNHRTHHAELEAVMRDAARYRWLRDTRVQRWEDAETGAPTTCTFDFDGAGHDVNAAVDAAMHNSAREG